MRSNSETLTQLLRCFQGQDAFTFFRSTKELNHVRRNLNTAQSLRVTQK